MDSFSALERAPTLDPYPDSRGRAAIEGGQTAHETARALNIHPATLYRALNKKK